MDEKPATGRCTAYVVNFLHEEGLVILRSDDLPDGLCLGSVLDFDESPRRPPEPFDMVDLAWRRSARPHPQHAYEIAGGRVLQWPDE